MGRRLVMSVLLLLVLPTVANLGALDNGFHLDDLYRVVGNPGVEGPVPFWQHFVDPGTSASVARLAQYRPLLPLTLSWSHALAGGHDPVVYHVGNLIIHLISVLLFWLLFRQLLGIAARGLADATRAGIALAAALLYGVHPISAVPINYVVARDLLQMQAALVAALLVWVHMRRRGGTWWGWAIVILATTASLLSKTNTVALPAVIIAYELTLGGHRLLSARPWRAALPFALLVGGFFVFTTTVLGFSDAAQLGMGRSGLGPFVEYGATQFAMHLTHYLRNVVWPLTMRPLPSIEAVVGLADLRLWAGALVVLGSLVVAWRLARSRPLVSFCILAYWLMFAPTSSVLPFRRLATDYRGYPSLPWLMLGVCVVAQGRLRPAVCRGLFVLALLGCVAGSVHQGRIWQDEQTLWGQSVRHGGEPIAHVNYARSLMGTNDELARQHLLLALNEQPYNVFAAVNLGLIEIRAGEVEAGVERVRAAAESVPDWADIQAWHSRALEEAGRLDAAAEAALRAARLDPRFSGEAVGRLYAAALAAQQRNDFAGSLDQLRELHGLSPPYSQSLFLEAYALQQLGDSDAAIATYRRWLGVDPDHAQGHFNLAFALMESGRYDDAIDRFRRALELRPDWASAHGHLAACLESTGRRDDAAEHRARFEALR